MNTDLSEGSSCQIHLSSRPQWHHEDRGERHHPSQTVRPVRVNIIVIHFQVLVVSQVQDKRNL